MVCFTSVPVTLSTLAHAVCFYISIKGQLSASIGAFQTSFLPVLVSTGARSLYEESLHLCGKLSISNHV